MALPFRWLRGVFVPPEPDQTGRVIPPRRRIVYLLWLYRAKFPRRLWKRFAPATVIELMAFVSTLCFWSAPLLAVATIIVAPISLWLRCACGMLLAILLCSASWTVAIYFQKQRVAQRPAGLPDDVAWP